MNKNEILSAKYPMDLFSDTEEKCKKEYKSYVKEWHPDISNDKDALIIFKKLTNFYNEALQNIKDKKFITKDTIKLSFKNSSKSIEFIYKEHKKFELGDIYIGRKSINYIINGKKFFDNFINSVNSIIYKDDNMEKSFKWMIPDIKIKEELTDGKFIIVLSKKINEFPLENIYTNIFNNKMDHKHVAWIISRLLNMNMLFYINDITINGIDLKSVYINPYDHTANLYGGWFYATKVNKKLIGTSKEIYSLLESGTEKIAKNKTDVECIKHLAIKLLGYNNLMDFKFNSKCPELIKEYILEASTNNILEEYTKWCNVIKNTYGINRKFTEMNIDLDKIYCFTK